MKRLVSLLMLSYFCPDYIITYTVFSLLIILNQYKSLKTKSSIIRADILFLTTFFIIHLLIPFLTTTYNFQYRHDDDEVLHYLAKISFYSIAVFSIGFFAISSGKNKTRKIYNKQLLIKYGRITDTLLILIITLFYISAGKSYFSADIYQIGGSSNTLSGLAGYLHILIIILLFLRITVTVMVPNFIKLKNLQLFKIILLIFFITSVISGDRSTILTLVLGLIAFMPTYNIKVSKFIKVLSIFGFFLLMGFTRIWRTSSIEYLNLSDLFYTSILNLADSFRVVIYANEITNSTGIHYGLTWLGPLAGLIPFLQGFLVKNNILKLETLNSPNLFTFYKHGNLNVSGEGSSILADLLVNFGHIGVILGMLMIGMLFKKIISIKSIQNSITTNFVVIILVSCSIYITRSTILYPLKFILWGFIINFFILQLTSIKSNE
jgi:oligosaccharide repeat unit polymerase